MTTTNPRRRRSKYYPFVFRKQIVVPTEHGAWPWMLVPLAVGAGVAGRFNLPVLLTLVGGLSLFLMRQPMTAWLRVRRGKARADNGPIALVWMGGLALLGLLCLVGLLAWERTAMLWLGLPFLLVLVMYLVAARYGRSGLRSLWMEVTGAAALSLMAPAAAIAANGRIIGWEWPLWGVMAAQNVLGALYARLRVADTRQRPVKRWPVTAVHAGGLGFVAGLSLGAGVPWGTAVPFIFFLLRAMWTAASPRPVANIKRFGFTELGIEIASGLWIVAGYWLN
jgi:hypothetical protein